jgi:hypothetical protein
MAGDLTIWRLFFPIKPKSFTQVSRRLDVAVGRLKRQTRIHLITPKASA